MIGIGFDPARDGSDTTVVVASTLGPGGITRVLFAERVTGDSLHRAFGPAVARAIVFGDVMARVTETRVNDWLAGRTRPDGRPRRSGHRHRGTVAWARRHG